MRLNDGYKQIHKMAQDIPTISLLAMIFLSFFMLDLLSMAGCDSDNKQTNTSRVDFIHANNHLAGTLTLPEGSGPFPVAIFVHGDGAMPADAHGYYNYLWKRLADNGIASYAWHKAGVNRSTGNWLTQSMDERADEVIAAIEMLKQRNDIMASKIGLIGYSQAGWVLPLVAKKSAYPDFMVIVSGAINWINQGDFLTRNRLLDEGFSRAQIQQAYACNRQEQHVLQPTSSYAAYQQYHKNISPECKKFSAGKMDKARFKFVKLNLNSDAREGLTKIQCPTLAIFADKDVNVNVEESEREYRSAFAASRNSRLTIKIFENAQHSLFKSQYISGINPGWSAIIKMELLGEDIFAENYLNYVTQWVKQTTNH